MIPISIAFTKQPGGAWHYALLEGRQLSSAGVVPSVNGLGALGNSIHEMVSAALKIAHADAATKIVITLETDNERKPEGGA